MERIESPVYRRLGNSGLVVPSVGIGCNNLGRPGTPTRTQEGTNEVIAAAVDAGISFFDIADLYGAEPGLSETMFGTALTQLGLDRDELTIVTKFGLPVGDLNGNDRNARGSRRYIMRAVEGALRRLRTDYLDTERFIAAENHYNLLDRRAELEILPAARHFGMGVLPYFPLANGLLTGKYRRDNIPAGSRLSHSKKNVLDAANWDQLEAFHSFCTERGITEVQAAFSWLAQQSPVTSVIAGATSAEQVRANAQAACLRFDAEDLAALDAIFPAPEKIALF